MTAKYIAMVRTLGLASVPVPLISYGGSSMLASFAVLGIVQSGHMRRMC